MFGVGSSAAGPPNNTLEEWLTAFDPAFADASLVGISLGLGTYNPDETGYVDEVSISINGSRTTWDFESPTPIPLPAGLPLLAAGLGVFGLVARRRRT